MHDKVGYFFQARQPSLRLAKTARRRVLIGDFGSTWPRKAADFMSTRHWKCTTCLDSHGRRDERSSDACVRSVFETVRTRGLYKTRTTGDLTLQNSSSGMRNCRRAALFQLAFVQTLRHVGKKRCFHTTSTYVFDTLNEHFDFWSPTASRASKAVRSRKGA